MAQLQVGGEAKEAKVSVLSPLLRHTRANHTVVKHATTVTENSLIMVGAGKAGKTL